jgi:flagellar assembly factor FliW
MKIQTQLFGAQDVRAEQILHFSAGIIGWEEDHQWILLGDLEQTALGWLQSLSTPAASLAVISPRRFFPDYRLRLDALSLVPLHVSPEDQLYLLAMVSHVRSDLTANLRAPIIVNANRQLGLHVITVDRQPMQQVIREQDKMLRKSA